jgi:hypothetical protein
MAKPKARRTSKTESLRRQSLVVAEQMLDRIPGIRLTCTVAGAQVAIREFTVLQNCSGKGSRTATARADVASSRRFNGEVDARIAMDSVRKDCMYR